MKISIITITYNSESTFEATIQSIRNQDYKELEYIVVDGGSTDRTLDIIHDNRDIISKFISEPDKGISDAFNKGIKMASGELIGIINSDDLLTDNALKMIEKKIQPDTDVLFGNAIMFGENVASYQYNSKSNPEDLRKSMSIVHPTTFIKKNAYERYGMFDLQYKCVMDRELLLRMLVNGARFQYLNENLAKMRLGGINQKNYLKVTLPEDVSISIRYGMPKWKANFIGLKWKARFIIANVVRKTPFSDTIRKLFHSKQTKLDI